MTSHSTAAASSNSGFKWFLNDDEDDDCDYQWLANAYVCPYGPVITAVPTAPSAPTAASGNPPSSAVVAAPPILQQQHAPLQFGGRSGNGAVMVLQAVEGLLAASQTTVTPAAAGGGGNLAGASGAALRQMLAPRFEATLRNPISASNPNAHANGDRYQQQHQQPSLTVGGGTHATLPSALAQHHPSLPSLAEPSLATIVDTSFTRNVDADALDDDDDGGGAAAVALRAAIDVTEHAVLSALLTQGLVANLHVQQQQQQQQQQIYSGHPSDPSSSSPATAAATATSTAGGAASAQGDLGATTTNTAAGGANHVSSLPDPASAATALFEHLLCGNSSSSANPSGGAITASVSGSVAQHPKGAATSTAAAASGTGGASSGVNTAAAAVVPNNTTGTNAHPNHPHYTAAGGYSCAATASCAPVLGKLPPGGDWSAARLRLHADAVAKQIVADMIQGKSASHPHLQQRTTATSSSGMQANDFPSALPLNPLNLLGGFEGLALGQQQQQQHHYLDGSGGGGGGVDGSPQQQSHHFHPQQQPPLDPLSMLIHQHNESMQTQQLAIHQNPRHPPQPPKLGPSSEGRSGGGCGCGDIALVRIGLPTAAVYPEKPFVTLEPKVVVVGGATTAGAEDIFWGQRTTDQSSRGIGGAETVRSGKKKDNLRNINLTSGEWSSRKNTAGATLVVNTATGSVTNVCVEDAAMSSGIRNKSSASGERVAVAGGHGGGGGSTDLSLDSLFSTRQNPLYHEMVGGASRQTPPLPVSTSTASTTALETQQQRGDTTKAQTTTSLLKKKTDVGAGKMAAKPLSTTSPAGSGTLTSARQKQQHRSQEKLSSAALSSDIDAAVFGAPYALNHAAGVGGAHAASVDRYVTDHSRRCTVMIMNHNSSSSSSSNNNNSTFMTPAATSGGGATDGRKPSLPITAATATATANTKKTTANTKKPATTASATTTTLKTDVLLQPFETVRARLYGQVRVALVHLAAGVPSNNKNVGGGGGGGCANEDASASLAQSQQLLARMTRVVDGNRQCLLGCIGMLEGEAEYLGLGAAAAAVGTTTTTPTAASIIPHDDRMLIVDEDEVKLRVLKLLETIPRPLTALIRADNPNRRVLLGVAPSQIAATTTTSATTSAANVSSNDSDNETAPTAFTDGSDNEDGNGVLDFLEGLYDVFYPTAAEDHPQGAARTTSPTPTPSVSRGGRVLATPPAQTPAPTPTPAQKGAGDTASGGVGGTTSNSASLVPAAAGGGGGSSDVVVLSVAVGTAHMVVCVLDRTTGQTTCYGRGAVGSGALGDIPPMAAANTTTSMSTNTAATTTASPPKLGSAATANAPTVTTLQREPTNPNDSLHSQQQLVSSVIKPRSRVFFRLGSQVAGARSLSQQHTSSPPSAHLQPGGRGGGSSVASLTSTLASTATSHHQAPIDYLRTSHASTALHARAADAAAWAATFVDFDVIPSLSLRGVYAVYASGDLTLAATTRGVFALGRLGDDGSGSDGSLLFCSQVGASFSSSSAAAAGGAGNASTSSSGSAPVLVLPLSPSDIILGCVIGSDRAYILLNGNRLFCLMEERRLPPHLQRRATNASVTVAVATVTAASTKKEDGSVSTLCDDDESDDNDDEIPFAEKLRRAAAKKMKRQKGTASEATQDKNGRRHARFVDVSHLVFAEVLAPTHHHAPPHASASSSSYSPSSLPVVPRVGLQRAMDPLYVNMKAIGAKADPNERRAAQLQQTATDLCSLYLASYGPALLQSLQAMMTLAAGANSGGSEGDVSAAPTAPVTFRGGGGLASGATTSRAGGGGGVGAAPPKSDPLNNNSTSATSTARGGAADIQHPPGATLAGATTTSTSSRFYQTPATITGANSAYAPALLLSLQPPAEALAAATGLGQRSGKASCRFIDCLATIEASAASGSGGSSQQQNQSERLRSGVSRKTESNNKSLAERFSRLSLQAPQHANYGFGPRHPRGAATGGTGGRGGPVPSPGGRTTGLSDYSSTAGGGGGHNDSEYDHNEFSLNDSASTVAGVTAATPHPPAGIMNMPATARPGYGQQQPPLPRMDHRGGGANAAVGVGMGNMVGPGSNHIAPTGPMTLELATAQAAAVVHSVLQQQQQQHAAAISATSGSSSGRLALPNTARTTASNGTVVLKRTPQQHAAAVSVLHASLAALFYLAGGPDPGDTASPFQGGSGGASDDGSTFSPLAHKSISGVIGGATGASGGSVAVGLLLGRLARGLLRVPKPLLRDRQHQLIQTLCIVAAAGVAAPAPAPAAPVANTAPLGTTAVVGPMPVNPTIAQLQVLQLLFLSTFENSTTNQTSSSSAAVSAVTALCQNARLRGQLLATLHAVILNNYHYVHVLSTALQATSASAAATATALAHHRHSSSAAAPNTSSAAAPQADATIVQQQLLLAAVRPLVEKMFVEVLSTLVPPSSTTSPTSTAIDLFSIKGGKDHWVVQDRHTSRLFCWGSNAFGQLGDRRALYNITGAAPTAGNATEAAAAGDGGYPFVRALVQRATAGTGDVNTLSSSLSPADAAVADVLFAGQRNKLLDVFSHWMRASSNMLSTNGPLSPQPLIGTAPAMPSAAGGLRSSAAAVAATAGGGSMPSGRESSLSNYPLNDYDSQTAASLSHWALLSSSASAGSTLPLQLARGGGGGPGGIDVSPSTAGADLDGPSPSALWAALCGGTASAHGFSTTSSYGNSSHPNAPYLDIPAPLLAYLRAARAHVSEQVPISGAVSAVCPQGRLSSTSSCTGNTSATSLLKSPMPLQEDDALDATASYVPTNGAGGGDLFLELSGRSNADRSAVAGAGADVSVDDGAWFKTITKEVSLLELFMQRRGQHLFPHYTNTATSADTHHSEPAASSAPPTTDMFEVAAPVALDVTRISERLQLRFAVSVIEKLQHARQYYVDCVAGPLEDTIHAMRRVGVDGSGSGGAMGGPSPLAISPKAAAGGAPSFFDFAIDAVLRLRAGCAAGSHNTATSSSSSSKCGQTLTPANRFIDTYFSATTNVNVGGGTDTNTSKNVSEAEQSVNAILEFKRALFSLMPQLLVVQPASCASVASAATAAASPFSDGGPNELHSMLGVGASPTEAASFAAYLQAAANGGPVTASTGLPALTAPGVAAGGDGSKGGASKGGGAAGGGGATPSNGATLAAAMANNALVLSIPAVRSKMAAIAQQQQLYLRQIVPSSSPLSLGMGAVSSAPLAAFFGALAMLQRAVATAGLLSNHHPTSHANVIASVVALIASLTETPTGSSGGGKGSAAAPPVVPDPALAHAAQHVQHVLSHVLSAAANGTGCGGAAAFAASVASAAAASATAVSGTSRREAKNAGGAAVSAGGVGNGGVGGSGGALGGPVGFGGQPLLSGTVTSASGSVYASSSLAVRAYDSDHFSPALTPSPSAVAVVCGDLSAPADVTTTNVFSPFLSGIEQPPFADLVTSNATTSTTTAAQPLQPTHRVPETFTNVVLEYTRNAFPGTFSSSSSGGGATGAVTATPSATNTTTSCLSDANPALQALLEDPDAIFAIPGVLVDGTTVLPFDDILPVPESFMITGYACLSFGTVVVVSALVADVSHIIAEAYRRALIHETSLEAQRILVVLQSMVSSASTTATGASGGGAAATAPSVTAAARQTTHQRSPLDAAAGGEELNGHRNGGGGDDAEQTAFREQLYSMAMQRLSALAVRLGVVPPVLRRVSTVVLLGSSQNRTY